MCIGNIRNLAESTVAIFLLLGMISLFILGKQYRMAEINT